MALCWSMIELTTTFLLVAGILYLAQLASSANEFRRCYNTTDEMHCFSVQYDTVNNRWLTASFESARQRCNSLNSTLIIIKDQEINNIVLNYISEPLNPIRFQSAWTDAYLVSDFNNMYTWHWVNSTLANLQASEVADTRDSSWYVASLEFRSQFHLTAQQPHFSNSYVCEYEASKCPSTGSNVRQFGGRCYIAVNASVSYYEARNRCLKDGGDLASFSNVASINFTTWLISDPSVQYWIGLRYTWYIWKDLGLEVKFSKWILDDWYALCLVTSTCPTCVGNLNWRPMDCSTVNSNYVVCHSVTSLRTVITSTVETTTSAAIVNSASVTQSSSIQQPTSLRTADSIKSSDRALGIGLGVGLGVPLVICMILTVYFAVKRKRLDKCLKKKAQGDSNELRTAQEPSVGHVNESVMDHTHYQHLNRKSDHSSGTIYDQLKKEPEQSYEECLPNRVEIHATA